MAKSVRVNALMADALATSIGAFGSKAGLETVQHTPALQPIPTIISTKREQRRDTLSTGNDGALQ